MYTRKMKMKEKKKDTIMNKERTKTTLSSSFQNGKAHLVYSLISFCNLNAHDNMPVKGGNNFSFPSPPPFCFKGFLTPKPII